MNASARSRLVDSNYMGDTRLINVYDQRIKYREKALHTI